MLPTRNEQSNNKRRATPLVVVIALVLTLSLVVGIGARYIYIRSTSKLTQVSALDFYFTIDLLGDTNELSELSRDIYLFGGGEQTATFSVQNFFDKLRTNDKAIKYTVTVEDDNANYDGCSIVSGASDPLAAEYVFTDDKTQQHTDFTLTMNAGYTKTTTVTVTVKSSSPYVKEMKLNYILSRNDTPLLYRVDDNAGDNFATLIIMANETIAKDMIQVSWTSVNQSANILQVDTTSPHVLDGTLELTEDNKPTANSYLSQITTTRAIAANESIQIYLFKADPNEDYSVPETGVPLDTTANKYLISLS